MNEVKNKILKFLVKKRGLISFLIAFFGFFFSGYFFYLGIMNNVSSSYYSGILLVIGTFVGGISISIVYRKSSRRI